MSLGLQGWHVTSTDTMAGGQFDMLYNNVTDNVVRNYEPTDPDKFMTTRASELDWLNPDQCGSVLEMYGPFDIIIGSDVIYLERLVEPFVNVLDMASTQTARAPIIYLCVEQRNAASHELLMNLLAARNYSVKRIMAKGWPSQCGPFDKHVHLMKIQKKKRGGAKKMDSSNSVDNLVRLQSV